MTGCGRRPHGKEEVGFNLLRGTLFLVGATMAQDAARPVLMACVWLAGMSALQADAALEQMRSIDTSPGSAICENCIDMFRCPMDERRKKEESP